MSRSLPNSIVSELQMPQDFEPSQSDQESLQSMSLSSQEVDAHRSLGDIRTLSEKKADEEDGSIGDSPTLGEPSYPLYLIDDALDVVELSVRYKVEKTLGQGGMGEVLLATDSRLDRKVAIKRILGDAAQSRTAVNRFLTEAKAIAALNHPNIVQIYDYGHDKEGPFLVMEYIDGQSLLERCRAGALPLEEAIEITCQLCDGLGRAHSQGIIHRDIKPANILLTRDGIPKLTDFGLAKSETADTGMTMTGAVLGTLDFMPPEQRLDATQVDARSDLWSLAATLYQMVTGKSPKIIKFNDVPKGLQAVLGKALEDTKEDRYQSASDFKEVLRQSLRDDSPDVVVMEQGQCLKCGAKNDSSRRFCRNPKCGVSLEVSCLSCSMKIPVWEAVCGSCGGKQQELATTIKQQKDSQRVNAENALETHNFALARTLATPLAEEQDPRLQQLVGWATQFLRDINTANKQYLDQISHWLSECLQHEKAHDYASGIKTLMQVSESMREVKIADHNETVAQVLSRLNRKQQEVRSLEKEIASRVKERSFTGLMPEVEKLLTLVPGHANMLKLKKQLAERNAKLQQVRDEAYAEAEKAFADQDYMGCLSALSKIDPSLEDSDILELRTRVTVVSDEVQRLKQQISQAIESKQYEGLLEVVDQYLALQSQDLERQQLRKQLIAREGKRSAQAAEIITKAKELRSKAEFSAAISELRRLPESLRTEEVVLLEIKCDNLKNQQQRAMGELRRRLDRSYFEGELAEVRAYLAFLTQLGDVKDLKFEQLQLEFQSNQDEYRHRLAEERKQKDSLKKVVIAGFVTAGVVLIVASSFMYSSYQRSTYQTFIRNALDRKDYMAVLSVDPRNEQALSMKKTADIENAKLSGDFSLLLSLDPTNPDGIKMKRISEALSRGDYKEALHIDPKNQKALLLQNEEEILNMIPVRNSVGMEFKLVPSVSRMIGEDESSSSTNTPFYVGIYEVTNEQFNEVMGYNPVMKRLGSTPSKKMVDLVGHLSEAKKPACFVNLEDAVEFCSRISSLPSEKAAGRVYRLPTEEEWEFVCRAGAVTKYSFGDDPLELGVYAWYRENSGQTTHPVGQKKPNKWGVYDMEGNVGEICQDISKSSSTSKSVLRGGCFLAEAQQCIITYARPVRLGRSSVDGLRVIMIQSEVSK